MTMQADPAAERSAPRPAAPEGTAAAAHEIKYRQDAAAYVAAMLAELRQIAGKAGLDKLVKSLDAAYYEAYGALDARARDAAPPDHREKISPSMEPNGAELR